ncbi:MAG: hypothetical protein QXJ31_04125 [Candidatus Bathyarchaeia archaeon]
MLYFLRFGLLIFDMDFGFITLIMLIMERHKGGVQNLTLWHEIEDLQKKKAELEFQLHSLEEKEKTLEERARLLEEKLAIKELEQRVRIKTESIEKLESRINELEQRLGVSTNITGVPEPEPMKVQQSENSFNLRKLFGE